MGNYVKQNKIGEGAYGEIFKCRSQRDSQTYVIKQVLTQFDGGGYNQSINEANIMKKLRNKNIVRYVDSFEEEDYFYLVMEYCDRGDLE